MSSTIKCPDCSSTISFLDNSEIGDVIVCDNCEVELEIVNLDPAQVDYLLAQK